jgi:hypothetical protein
MVFGGFRPDPVGNPGGEEDADRSTENSGRVAILL